MAKLDAVLAANIAKVNGLVFSTGPAFSGLLDTYTGAAAAYSTRRLNGQYTGAAMRVREDSGDTETDIGFDANGNLLTADIATHCGSANGYVTKWYDQAASGGTGSGNDAAQTTNGRQPQIYNGSAVITENGKPAIQADDTPQSLGFTSTAVGSAFIVYRKTADKVLSTLIGGSSSHQVDGGGSLSVFNRAIAMYDGTNTVRGTTAADNTTQHLGSVHIGTDALRLDGAQEATGTFNTISVSRIFQREDLLGDNRYVLVGRIQEVVIYGTEQGSTNITGIEGNLNAHFQIGNFPNPTSGLLSTYTGAAAAYSVRQLANTAALSMRVRRDNDDAEQDFGFDANGDLDTAAIATFVGSGNNGYVSKWYDQSGNGNDAEQSTHGDQMQIYNGSAVITENGKPALQHRTVNGGLDITGYTGSTDATVLAVMANIINEAIPVISFASGVPYLFRSQATQTQSCYRGFGTSPNSFLNSVEDTDLLNGEVYTAFRVDQGLVIGIGSTSGWTGSTFYLGWAQAQLFQEVIFWNSDQDTAGNITGIQNNVNNYFSIY